MNGHRGNLPSIDQLKDQAKRLRVALDSSGDAITHGKALELVARQHGYKDWNTIHAATGNGPPVSFQIGQVMSGTYLGQRFTGKILAIETIGETGRYRLSFHFDEPVDVVTFDSFSSFRQRVTCTVGPDGTTSAKTSNGEPHMRLDM